MRRLWWNQNAISSKKLARPSHVEGDGMLAIFLSGAEFAIQSKGLVEPSR